MGEHRSMRSQAFFVGRAPTVLARAMVFIVCFALTFSGVFLKVGMAQVIVNAPVSLREVPVPVPTAAIIPGTLDPDTGVSPIPGPGTDLTFNPLTTDIVKDQAALIKLGKALFWDMQVGSDGIQACATCHFNAGADIRSKNSISPGLKDTNFLNNPLGGSGDTMFGNSTEPYTANDPNYPFGSDIQPPNPNLNVPGRPQFKPNYQLTALDFPLNGWFNPTSLVPRGPGVTVLQESDNVDIDVNDVISSMGVRRTQFVAVTPGQAVDTGTPLPDIFNTANPGQLDTASRVRRVEPRNAPTVINAVFNFDNFWDGRASFIFNGVNPFGFRDRASTLKQNIAGTLTDVFIRVTNSSLASQAVGPPGSDFEMSWAGRTFPDIGKKMVSMQPLAKQLVSNLDSVLGPMALGKTNAKGVVSGKKGLKDPATGKPTTYQKMVQAAFQDQWWNSPDIITVLAGTAALQRASSNDPRTMPLGLGKTTVSKGINLLTGVKAPAPSPPLPANQFTQMMFNFSLFFGLAVQAYEATLISDDTPFDRFMGAPSLDPPIPGDFFALTDQEQLGFAIFNDPGPDNNVGAGAKCATCHILPITTGATVLDDNPDLQGVPQAVGGIIEFMVMADGADANYDHAFYNIAVRRTTEDLGRAGTSPFPNPLTPGRNFPLSYVELTALNNNGGGTSLLPPDVARFVPNVPMLPRLVTAGAFKACNLRNALYTGPYFHNGDSATLRQTVDFYARGGNFPNTNLDNLTVDIDGIAELQWPEFLPSAKQNIEALVAFVANAFTDQRVALEKAPFDHPQLFVPNGSPNNNPQQDTMLEIKAVGNAGRPKVGGKPNPIPTFLNLDPQSGGG